MAQLRAWKELFLGPHQWESSMGGHKFTSKKIPEFKVRTISFLNVLAQGSAFSQKREKKDLRKPSNDCDGHRLSESHKNCGKARLLFSSSLDL